MSELKVYVKPLKTNVLGQTIVGQSYYLKSDVDAVIAELKAKLESVQASMYADVVDANMENRRLKRALWMARAERAKEMCQRLLIQGFDPKWEEVERKCLKKAKEYL